VMSGLSPLMYVLCPILFLWCDWNIFPNARPLEVFCIPLVVSLIVMAAMLWLARRQYIPFVWHGRQLFMAFELLPQALASLLKPFGKPLLPIHPVTPKGTAAMGRHIDVRTLAGLVVLMLGLITGLVRAGHDERFGGHPLEMAMLLGWTVYFMSIITLAGLMCFEPWYRRRAERFDLAEEPASLLVRGQAIPVRILNMSVTGALIRMPHPLVLPVDQPMALQKRHIPAPLPCTLVYRSETDLAVDFLPIANPAVRQAFVRVLYTNPVIQAHQQATFALWPVVKRLGRLFVAGP
jgi:hypothetical protein